MDSKSVDKNENYNTLIDAKISAEFTGSPLLQLPNEIWQLVYNLIPQKDLVQKRLVSKKWREYIDKIATFHADFFDRLNSSQSTLDRIFNIRIRSCSFHGLKEVFEPRFKYPLLVNDITLSNVSSENLVAILSTCSQVEILRFFSTLVMDKQFESGRDYSNVFGLRCLKALHIVVHTIGPRPLNSKSSIFDTLFASSANVLHFNTLQKLNICFSMKAEEWIQLFDFISRHSATLRSLAIRCMCNEEGCDQSDFSEVNQIELIKQLKLRSLIIRCDSGSRFSSALHSIFDSIVSAQRLLECVSLRYAGLKFPLVVKVLTNCKATVSSVRFTGIESTFAEVCDGSILGNCSVLRNFVLGFVEKTYIVMNALLELVEEEGEEISPEPLFKYNKAVSEFSLPRSLTSLSWEGLWIKTQELKEMCKGNDCPKRLTTLELFNVGFNEEFGVTVEIFVMFCRKFLELETIKVQKLNLSGGAEILKWQKIVQSAISLEIYESICEFDSLEPKSFSVFRFSNRCKREEFLMAIDSLHL